MSELFEKALADVPQWIMDCPVFCDWLQFKGETYFGILNYEASLKARKPMVDLSYCATRAMNGIVLLTVQYDKKKFTRSPLAREPENE
jgi:hypothetical protein